jgi:hypothetical protein
VQLRNTFRANDKRRASRPRRAARPADPSPCTRDESSTLQGPVGRIPQLGHHAFQPVLLPAARSNASPRVDLARAANRRSPARFGTLAQEQNDGVAWPIASGGAYSRRPARWPTGKCLSAPWSHAFMRDRGRPQFRARPLFPPHSFLVRLEKGPRFFTPAHLVNCRRPQGRSRTREERSSKLLRSNSICADLFAHVGGGAGTRIASTARRPPHGSVSPRSKCYRSIRALASFKSSVSKPSVKQA